MKKVNDIQNIRKNQPMIKPALTTKQSFKKRSLYFLPLITYPFLQSCGSLDSIVQGIQAGIPLDFQDSLQNLVFDYTDRTQPEHRTGSGNDVIVTGPGDDQIAAGQGADQVNAGAGNDIIIVVGIVAEGQFTLQQDVVNSQSDLLPADILAEFIRYYAPVTSQETSQLPPDSSSQVEREIIDGGEQSISDIYRPGDVLALYGLTSLLKVEVLNIETIYIDGLAKITQQQFTNLRYVFGNKDSSKLVVKIDQQGDNDLAAATASSITSATQTLNLSNLAFESFNTAFFETDFTQNSPGTELVFITSNSENLQNQVSYLMGIDVIVLPRKADIEHLNGIGFEFDTRFYYQLDPNSIGGTYLLAGYNIGSNNLLIEFAADEIDAYRTNSRFADISLDQQAATTLALSHDEIDLSTMQLYAQEQDPNNIGFEIATITMSGNNKYKLDDEIVLVANSNDNDRFAIYKNRQDSTYALYLKDVSALNADSVLKVEVEARDTTISAKTYSNFRKTYTITVVENGLDYSIDAQNIPVSTNSYYTEYREYRTFDGDDVISTGVSKDIILGGAGADTINAGGGDDIIVVLGKAAALAENDDFFNNPFAENQPLSSIAKNILQTYYMPSNIKLLSDVVQQEIIDGGDDSDTIFSYGLVELDLATVSNVEQLVVHGMVSLSKSQLESFQSISGKRGDAKIIIETGFTAQSDLGTAPFDANFFSALSDKIDLSSIAIDQVTALYLEKEASFAADGQVALYVNPAAPSEKLGASFLLQTDVIIVGEISDLAYLRNMEFKTGTKFYMLSQNNNAATGVYLFAGKNLESHSDLTAIADNRLLTYNIITHDAIDFDKDSGTILLLHDEDFPIDLNHPDAHLAPITAFVPYVVGNTVNGDFFERVSLRPKTAQNDNELFDIRDHYLYLKENAQVDYNDQLRVEIEVVNLSPYGNFVKTYTVSPVMYDGFYTTQEVVITTGDEDDRVYVGDDNNIITTNGGNDAIISGGGRDTINAGDGNDWILAQEQADTIDAGAGDDVIFVIGQTSSAQIKDSTFVTALDRLDNIPTAVRDYLPVATATLSSHLDGGGQREVIDGGSNTAASPYGDILVTIGTVTLQKADISNIETVVIDGLVIAQKRHLEDFDKIMSHTYNSKLSVVIENRDQNRDLTTNNVSDSSTPADFANLQLLNLPFINIGTIDFDRVAGSGVLVWYDSGTAEQRPTGQDDIVKAILGVNAVFINSEADLERYRGKIFDLNTEFYLISSDITLASPSLFLLNRIPQNSFITKVTDEVLAQYEIHNTYTEVTLDVLSSTFVALENTEINYTDLIRQGFEPDNSPDGSATITRYKVGALTFLGRSETSFDKVELTSPTGLNVPFEFMYGDLFLTDFSWVRPGASFALTISIFDTYRGVEHREGAFSETYTFTVVGYNNNAPRDIELRDTSTSGDIVVTADSIMIEKANLGFGYIAEIIVTDIDTYSNHSLSILERSNTNLYFYIYDTNKLGLTLSNRLTLPDTASVTIRVSDKLDSGQTVVYDKVFNIELYSNDNTPSDIALAASAPQEVIITDGDDISIGLSDYTNYVIGTLSATDADLDFVNDHVFSVESVLVGSVANTDLQFSVNEQNELLLTALQSSIANPLSLYSVTVRVQDTLSDRSSVNYDKTFNIQFYSNDNAPRGIELELSPVLSLTTGGDIKITARDYQDYVIGTLSATDADRDFVNRHTFSIDSVSDQNLQFSIDENNNIIMTARQNQLPETASFNANVIDRLASGIDSSFTQVFNIQFEPSPYLIVEEGEIINFVVTLAESSSQDITVDYRTAALPGFDNGFAAAGFDYISERASITFASGQTKQTIQVRTIDDIYARETPEVFTLRFFNPADGTERTDITATAAFVLDNEQEERRINKIEVTPSSSSSPPPVQEHLIKDFARQLIKLDTTATTPLLDITVDPFYRQQLDIRLDLSSIIPALSMPALSQSYTERGLSYFPSITHDEAAGTSAINYGYFGATQTNKTPILYFERKSSSIDELLTGLNDFRTGSQGEEVYSKTLLQDTVFLIWRKSDANGNADDLYFSTITKNGDDFMVGKQDIMVIRDYQNIDDVFEDVIIEDLTKYGTANNDIHTISLADSTVYYGLAGDDTIDTAFSLRTVIYGGEGNDRISGGRRDDYLVGDSGNDVIAGDDGNDYLSGGKGADTLTGGDGDDGFVFSFSDIEIVDHRPDTISDFQFSQNTPPGPQNYSDFFVLKGFDLQNGPNDNDLYIDLLRFSVDDTTALQSIDYDLKQQDVIIYDNAQINSFSSSADAYTDMISYLATPVSQGLATYMLLSKAPGDQAGDIDARLSYIITAGGDFFTSYDVAIVKNVDVSSFKRENFLVSDEEAIVEYANNNRGASLITKIPSSFLQEKSNVLTYGFENPLDDANISEITKEDHKRVVREVFAEYDLMTGLDFSEAQSGEKPDIYLGFSASFTGGNTAGITRTTTMIPSAADDNGFADLMLAATNDRASIAEIYLNPDFNKYEELILWDYHESQTFPNDAGTELTYNNASRNGVYYTLVHEIAHALGIEHPVAYSGVESSPHQSFANDYGFYSSASYNAIDKDLSPGTVMLYDLALLQDLYGKSLNARAGDTTYGFNAIDEAPAGNVGYVADVIPASLNFGAVGALNEYYAGLIWDTGGQDTLDASHFTQNQFINLLQGGRSSIGEYRNNILIAYGTVIENAKGGAGSDLIIGNSSANVIEGGAGDDFIISYDGQDELYGGAGNDIFKFTDINQQHFDTIKDFAAGDLLDFTALFEDNLLTPTNYQTYISLLDVANTTTKEVMVDIDGIGAADAVKLALLEVDSGSTIDNNDFDSYIYFG